MKGILDNFIGKIGILINIKWVYEFLKCVILVIVINCRIFKILTIIYIFKYLFFYLV